MKTIHIPRNLSIRLTIILLIPIALFTVTVQAASAAQISVTTTADSVADDGLCTLREAIQAANNNTAVGDCTAGSSSDADTILFAIPGAGPHTIQVQSALPELSQRAIIDGYSQAGAQANTNPVGESFNGVLQIVLDGSQAGDATGLNLVASSSEVHGLVLNNFDVAIALTENGFNVIAGNLIGVDVDGTNAAGNVTGVLIESGPLNEIGGSDPARRNVISGNQEGVVIRQDTAFLNNVQGNLIGTDVSGSQVVSNTRQGIVVSQGAENNNIQDNVISGNGAIGLLIENEAVGTNVYRNWIGTNPAGEDLGNDEDGILARNSGTQIIGSISEGNIIAYNGRSGVGIDASISASNFKGILGNRIYANGGLGIDLRNDGVTENDLGDADGENDANNLQNFPVLEAAQIDGGALTITGTLNSTANTDFWIEFFANDICDPSGYGEGQRYLGIDQTITTDADGNAQFSVTYTGTVASLVAIGDAVSATATTAAAGDTNGNTSEFSKCILAASSDTPADFLLYLPIAQRD